MTCITPMFAGWHRKLHGRRPVRNGIAMRSKASEISSLCVRQAKDLFGDLLAIELLAKVPPPVARPASASPSASS